MDEGGDIQNGINCPDSTFDYVTVLAVIEDLTNPGRVLKEIHRILKPKGKLIITAPKKQAEWIIKLYAKDVVKTHVHYYTEETIRELVGEMFTLISSRTFLFGLNQVFCLRKRGEDS